MHDKNVALVTGANKGIGFEVCRQLAGHGFTVVLAARDGAKVADAASRLRGEGLDALGVVLDVTDPAGAEAAARLLDERFGRLRLLVNNAGIGPRFVTGTKPSQLDMETLRATYETNVFGAFAVTRSLLPLLRRSAPSRIINQSSTLGSLGRPERPRLPVLRRQPPRLQLVEVRPQRPHPGLRQGPRRGADLGQLGLPRLGQDRHGIGCSPPHGRAGCGHRREAGDDGRPADRHVRGRCRRDTLVGRTRR